MHIVCLLVYNYICASLQTLCFHTGMTSGFIWDYGTPEVHIATDSETASLLKDIHEQIVECNKHNIYSHKVRQCY